MVAFLDHNVGDTRLVILLQLYARISDGQELIVENLNRRYLIRTKVEEKNEIIII